MAAFPKRAAIVMFTHDIFHTKYKLMQKLKHILLITLIVTCCSLKGQCIEKNFDWNNVISAIAYTESRYDPNAVSKTGNHVGYLQISKIMIRDCNRILGYNKYTYKDRYSIEKSKEIFHLIQKTYNPTNNVEKAIRMWNGGTGFTKDGTEAYYQRVKRKLNELEKKQG